MRRLGVVYEGRRLGTAFVNVEAIPLGVANAALIHAFSNPATSFS
jgi:hypothetical protein